ncbi:hypothetical protein [Acetobacter fallax]|uniref:Phage protein n=1 Tax=Acetobacter fallax TaxID=1737473 RepID=A0ABX0KAN0_9PROT|nr:hypothetical protein [Acetobacter fallax]NHO32828.1 hypothetical protein [Acetobacter fallax]NHO36388.1 hypothetical protein [Acetobacter fallax]
MTCCCNQSRADRIAALAAKGLAKAASAAGQTVTLYRPTVAMLPLEQPPTGTLSVLFDQTAALPGISPAVWGHPLAYAACDITRIMPGDYMLTAASAVLPGAVADTYFVSRVDLNRPALVVRTNAVMTVLESDPTADDKTFGLRPAEGPAASKDVKIADGWPVSLIAHGGTNPPTRLGTDVRAGMFSVLMPAIPGQRVYAGLRLRDALGHDYHTSAVEVSDFGVRLTLTEDRV